MTNQEKLQAIQSELYEAQARAAVAELRARNERDEANPSEREEKREYYEYIIGRFSGMSKAIDIVDRILHS